MYKSNSYKQLEINNPYLQLTGIGQSLKTCQGSCDIFINKHGERGTYVIFFALYIHFSSIGPKYKYSNSLPNL